MRKLITILFVFLVTAVTAQVKQAYLGEDGRVLVRELPADAAADFRTEPTRSINQMPGFPKKIPAHPNFKNFRNLTLHDINGDGKQEILVASLNALRVFNQAGQLLWSVPLTGTPIYPPSVAVMNGTGFVGIVQVTGGVPNNGRVYLFDVAGNTMPGWPVSFSSHWILCAPTLADLNNDGQKEIIVQTRTSNNLHALRMDGTVLWTYNLGGTPAITPSVGDIDNDGVLEVIAGTSNGNLFAVNGQTGTIKPGYPIIAQDYSLSYQSPILVDLDGNGTLSIVGSTHGNAPHYYVRNHDGTFRAGWPVPVDENSWTYSPPTVVNLYGNNDFRIFASRPVGEEPKPMLYGFLPNATMMPNFPIVKSGGLESFISVADITGDGAHDLIFGSNMMVDGQGFIHAYHVNTGQQIAGFPLRPTGFTFMNGATLGDVNGDGMLDLVALSYEQTFSASDSAYVNVYELNVPLAQANVLFGTYKGSNDRTGFVPRSSGPTFPPPQNLTATTAPNSVTLNWQAPATAMAQPWKDVVAVEGGVVGISELAGNEQGTPATEPQGMKMNSGSGTRGILFDNGPFVNNPGAGPGGSDLSQLHSGMTTFGPSINQGGSISVADDFTITGNPWNVESFTFYAYQTSTTHPTPPVSTITSGRLRIWNGSPANPASQVIWGDMNTNVMTSTSWTNAYRVSETAVNNQRPIMKVVCSTPGLTLQPGQYWVEWAATGTIASGPWGVPVTINGQTTTGDALQQTTTSGGFVPLVMGGTNTGYGLSFLIEGTAGGGGGNNLTGYNIYRDGTLIGNVAAGTTTYTNAPVPAGTYTYGVTAVYGAPNPGESSPVTVNVTVQGPSGAQIAVNPTSITKTMQPGQTGTQALTISNSGAAPLNYTLTVTTNSRGTSAVETPREGYSLPMGSDRMNPTDAATPAEPVIKPLDTPIYRNMTQGFEDITLLPGLGWALTNNSSPLGTTGWFQGNPTVFPAQAGPETSYIGANYNNTGSVGTISNWLITPVLELQNGATVTFWTRTPTNSTWADRLELRLSTAGNSTNVGSTATSVGDFTTLLLSVNPNLTGTGYPQVWTEFTATIQGLTGTVNGRLAFRYFVTDGGANGNNSNFVGIDSFVYTGQGGGGGNTWLTATPLTGTVPAGGSAQVEVGFNSNNLALGTYTGNINIASNATNQPSLDVPVTLNVAGPSGGLPFEEDFASGSFATNGWTFDPAQGNWRILTTAGNPAPSAEFYWSPSATNYSFALVSKNLDATANTTVVLSFDVFLDNYATTTVEELKVYVWNGTAWVLIDTFSNQGDDFPWTSKTYNISTHAAGKVTKVKFEASGANSFNLNWWRLDNIKVFQPAAVDLAALAVVGNVTPSVGTATTYNVQVKNNGGSTQSNYTVKLRVNGTEVASVAGPAIAPTQTLNVPLNWTPAAQGPVVLTGEVIVAGDENPANNITPPFNVVVQPQGLVAITIGAQTTLPTYRIPFDFYWKNSLSQTIFYPEEMNNMAGAITGINLFNNFATDLPNKAVKIWMGTTNLPNLADGWVDPSTLTLVFDGTVNFPLGANTIFVPFNQPFIYTGGNLVLYTFRVWEDQYFNSNDKFYVTETPNKPNRTRHVQADATQYDPANPPAPAAAQLKSAHPDITLFFNTAGLGALQGVVSNNAGGPVEGVKVQIVGTSSIAYTNAQGQYSFPYVLAGQINVEFSKLGFVTQTLPATITADQTTTLNVTLQAMPQVTVSGFVAGNDAPTVGLSGAAVVLEGYQNYNVTTGANGQFSIPGVYANNTYTIKVTKEGYQPYQGTVVVGGSNVTVPNIILTEIILSPKNLTATISPTNPNLVNLQWNMLQDVEFRYDDGVSTGQLGFQSGTTSGVIGAKHTQSASLTELSWYLTSEGGPHPSIVIRIFGLTAQGLPNSQNVLYEATVTNVDNQWNTHTLPQPVTATGGFFMGVAYAGFVGIATDDGVGAPWVFQDNTHYYNSNFTTGTWSTFESLGTDFRRNTLLRAKGVPGAVNSYAIEPPIIGGEAMSYIPGKKVETGEPAWSTDQSKGLQYFKVYRNGQLLASNITQMQYSYTEMQLGQKCYHVTAVYGSGESAPSNTACVNILVGVNEQLEASTQLFPNPATETFSIRSLPMQRITITNALGVVVSDALLSGETTLKVNTSDWKAGVYLVQIHTSNGTITKRMVVVR